MNRAVFDQALAQAKLKVKRAHRHASEAEVRVQQYLSTDFCQLREELDAKTGAQTFRVVAAELAPEVSLAIGDAFHNLSTALDYVSTGLLRAVDSNLTRVTFPLDESRQALRQTFKAPKPGRGAPRNRIIIEQFPSFVCLLLNKIKPYRGGNFLVWEVRKADNLDKHNLIVPTITIARLVGISFLDVQNRNTISDLTAEVLAGGILNLIAYRNNSRLEITDKGQASVSMNFPQSAEVFAGQPVFPTLLRCIHGIKGMLEIIEAASIKPFIRTKNT